MRKRVPSLMQRMIYRFLPEYQVFSITIPRPYKLMLGWRSDLAAKICT